MAKKTVRDLWDSRAKSRMKNMQRNEVRRLSSLYEDTCWRFIEPLLPAGTGRILETGCGTGR